MATLDASGDVSDLGVRHARVGAGRQGIRLSSPGWAGFSTRDLELATSGDRLFEIVREKLNATLPTFAVRLRQFVDLYLDDAGQRAADAFRESDDPFVRAEDWIYSAWLPMPNVRVEIPGPDRSAFAEFNVFFWTGERAIGVHLEPSTSIIGSQRRNLEQLQTVWPDLDIIEVTKDRFPGNDNAFPHDLFPAELMRFWEDVLTPQGPSLSGILERPFAG